MSVVLQVYYVNQRIWLIILKKKDEDPEEVARDRVVEKLIVSAVTKPIEDKADIEDEIRCKFKAKRITVKEMKTFADRRGKFDQSVVWVSPVNLKDIWGCSLGLKNHNNNNNNELSFIDLWIYWIIEFSNYLIIKLDYWVIGLLNNWIESFNCSAELLNWINKSLTYCIIEFMNHCIIAWLNHWITRLLSYSTELLN